MFQRVLVATDLNPDAERAVDMAVELAARDEADLVVVHVFEIPAYVYTAAYTPVDCLGPLQDTAQQQFGELLSSVRKRWARASGKLRVGVPHEEILAAIAEHHPDLVVVGTHGRRGIAHALLGSVAEKVVRLSPVPVLTARPAADAVPA